MNLGVGGLQQTDKAGGVWQSSVDCLNDHKTAGQGKGLCLEEHH